MAASVYSWVLDKIRLGWGQVESYTGAIIRFAGTAKDVIFKQWLTAWSGKYIAEMMINNPNVELQQFLDTSAGQPAAASPTSSPDVIRPWFPFLTDAPYDFAATYSINSGGMKQYGQWRYEALEDDTYLMVLTRMQDILVKEYRIRNKSDVSLVGLTIIGKPTS